MDNILEILQNLAGQTGFANLTWGNYLMIAVALVFLYLAIARGYEPLLLVPISFGMLLVNMYPPIMEEGGLLHYFFLLDEWAILPSLIFMGVGAGRRNGSAVGIKFDVVGENARFYDAGLVRFPDTEGDFDGNFAVLVAGKAVDAVEVDGTDTVGIARRQYLRLRRILHNDLAGISTLHTPLIARRRSDR